MSWNWVMRLLVIPRVIGMLLSSQKVIRVVLGELAHGSSLEQALRMMADTTRTPYDDLLFKPDFRGQVGALIDKYDGEGNPGVALWEAVLEGAKGAYPKPTVEGGPSG